MSDRLRVQGAREHNLRNVDVDLPRDALIVFTGLSGSGKSSLAFDTIFAEGQRRYVESLSAYARQFLGQMDKPDVDFIEGLSPAVSIDQKSTNRNPRSTVGTITEVYDYLRLLYARAGTQFCPVCGEQISRQTPQQIVDRLLDLPTGTRYQVLAPVVRGRKGEYADLFADLQSKGFARARVDGTVMALTEVPPLEKKLKHTIDVVVDRLVAKEGVRRRLTDSVETALGLAGGLLVVELVDAEADDPGRERRFSEHRACPNDHELTLDEIEPRTFSFNAPYGACPECTGIGSRLEVDPDLVIPDEDATLAGGAVAPWSQTSSDYFQRVLTALSEELGFGMDVPWRALPQRAKDAILHGRDHKVHVRYKNRWGRERQYSTGFEGVISFIERRHAETESDWSKDRYEAFMREVPCPVCDGARLKPEVLAVRVGGLSIADLCRLPIDEAKVFLDRLELGERERAIAAQVLKEIQARMGFLLDVGLDYLSLERPAGTLSGGEAQRIRLATQIGSGLVGVLYVLDEPSIGLHQRDNRRLIETLTRLRDLGNTLIVVEHDEETIRTADWVVDIGPGAGEHGGRVVHSGDLAGLLRSKESVTGAYLAGRREIPVPDVRRPVDRERRAAGDRRPRAQPAQHRRGRAAGRVRRGDGGVGLGQVDPGELDPVHGAGQRAQRRPAGPGPLHPGDGPGAPGQGGARRPGPDRPHPAVEPGDLHRRVGPRAQAVRRDDRGEGARLRARAVLVQRQGRALRRLQRRRHHQDRDELPARRLRAVRGVPRCAVQPRDPRGALQGQDGRRRARHADRGGRGVLRGRAGDLPAPQDAGGRGPRATCGSASRRRRCPAARPSASSSPPSSSGARPAGPSTCWTSRPRACTSRTSASCSACCSPSWTRATAWS